MKSLICEIGEKIFLEIPHQRPPKCFVLSEHKLKRTIFYGNYGDYFETWAVDNGFCKPAPDCTVRKRFYGRSSYRRYRSEDFLNWKRELFSNQDALIGYMGHDLHGLHVFDTVEEAMTWCKTYKEHQWVKATIQLKELIRGELR